MSTILTSIFFFILALGLLITVHEFGHFWVARRLGVKVLRFSIGFGKPLWRRQRHPDDTEYVIAAIPLGGYVKMLDEREGEVAENELPLAFNRKPLASRFAIVAAGPLFNFLFAIAAYWLVFIIGVTGLKPVVGEVISGSPADRAGFESGDVITAVDGEQTATWNQVVLELLDLSLDGTAVSVEVRDRGDRPRQLNLDLMRISEELNQGNLLETIGLSPARPSIPPVIGRLQPGGAAEQAGIKAGDRIVTVNGTPIEDWEALALYISEHPGQAIVMEVERGGAVRHIQVTPKRHETDEGVVGRIGAAAEIPEDLNNRMFTTVRYSPLSALAPSLVKTWDMSVLTLKMVGKMIMGDVSTENISGPLSIAQFAGTTASAGVTAFLGFLAIVSISLGVLNLLPIPILDGGHLFYYIIEFFKGSPVSEEVQVVGQKLGLIVIIGLMVLAFYNDIVRLFNS